MKWKILILLLIFGIILLPPLLLRKKASAAGMTLSDPSAEQLIILTAHNDSVKQEMAIAFRKYYRKKYGKEIFLDYRSPGGTSDIIRFINDRYKMEFRRWCETHDLPWNSRIAAAFCSDRTDRDHSASAEEKKARKAFLNSDIGIGVDLMCGGGTFDMASNARNGFAVDAGIMKTDPELLAPDVIPPAFGGELLYDPQGRYYGLCLSTFGLCYNTDRMKELSDPRPPARWSDLAEGRFYNRIVIADPTKSGSVNKCFEIIIQQVMAECRSPDQGWTDGLNLLKRIVANASAVTDSAGKVTRDVAAGSAAAGIAIDTYGLTESEWSAIQFGGTPHFFYVAPEGGTAVSPDPVQLLRGAPNRKNAVEFIRFMLSKEGQKILMFKPGTPGGPVKAALRRPAIRKDLYGKEYLPYRSDPDYDPYRSGSSFRYRPEWTSRYYSLLRIVIRTLMLDCQDELKLAWRTILENGGPSVQKEAMKHFNELPFTYATAAKAAKDLSSGTPAEVARLKREWRELMRTAYLRAAETARKEGVVSR